MKEQTLAQEKSDSMSEIKAQALAIVAQSPCVMLALFDTQGRLLVAGHELSRLCDQTAENLTGQCLSDLLPDLHSGLTPVLERVLTSGETWVAPRFPETTQGLAGYSLFSRATYHPMLTPTGETSGVLVTLESTSHGASLSGAATDAQDVLDHLSTYILLLSREGAVLDANDLLTQTTGLNLSSLLGKPLWQTPLCDFDSETGVKLQSAVSQASAGHATRFDARWTMPDVGPVAVDFLLSPAFDEAGEVSHLIASARDITERFQRESKLLSSESLLRQIFEATADALILADHRGQITLSNQRAALMFGYSPEEFLTRNVDDLLPDAMRHNHAKLREGFYRHPVARSMADKRDLFGRRGDGSLFPIEVGLTPVEISGDKRVLATVVDVTVQKRFQSKLEETLKAKSALLNEVHHRVKNNLQVVSSLLSLQARGIPEAIREPFTESQGRIKAMALIHQQFYEKQHMDRIEALSYLKNLCDLLRQSYSGLTRKLKILMDSDQQTVFLSMDQALPFGLLINELVTNAIKHAFVGREQGSIQMYVTRDKGKIHLTLADDGIGIPVEKELGKGTSLGFQLIPDLARQLEAELSLCREVGSRFEVTFAEGVRE